MGIAFLISLLIVIIFGNSFIKWLKYKEFGDSIREVGPKHIYQKGTPTMGAY